jgi:glycosyltransferase involved in cell wall biosynthesis
MNNYITKQANAARPIRILFVENGIGYGGAAISLHNHLSYLDRNQFIPVVVTSRRGKGYDKYSDVAQWSVIPDRLLNRTLLRLWCHRLIPSHRTANRVISFLDYMFNLAPFVLRLIFVALRKRVNLVVLNNDPLCNMGGFFAAQLLRLPLICFVRGSLANTRTIRYILNRVKHFVAVSRFIKSELMTFSVPSSNVTIVYSIRDWNHYAPHLSVKQIREEWGVSHGDVIIGITGLLIPWKGHRIFIQAAAEVLRELPRTHFFIIGGSVDEFPDYPLELKTLVDSVDTQGRIRFLGHCADMPRILGGLDIVVHASTVPEPLGMVVAEGMVMGKPVVASASGGPLEMIEDGRTGFLIPPGDPAALSSVLIKLSRDPHLRQDIGRSARASALNTFCSERETAKLEALYRDVATTQQKNY